MKRIAFSLAVLAALALTTGVAHAGGPYHSGHAKVALVGHHGHYGHHGYWQGPRVSHYRGYHNYSPGWNRSYYSAYPRSYGYGCYGSPYHSYGYYRPYSGGVGWSFRF
ncbi:MAG TPA: hypothetical protein VMY37_11955 [Thermoguttaceae bacterium]|nr:hypothetical protein [Thermoguttaceae bacterium]